MKRLLLVVLIFVAWALMACDPFCMGCGYSGFDPALPPISGPGR